MIIDQIKSEIEQVLSKTLQKVVRTQGSYPLSLMKVHEDTTSIRGWKMTSISSRKEGEGLYGSKDFLKMKDDSIKALDEEGVIGIVYSIPLTDVKDVHGDPQGDIWVVGVHVKEGGKNYSDTMVSFYSVEELGSGEGGAYKDRMYQEYLNSYLAAQRVGSDDEIEKILAQERFDREAWDSLEPRFKEYTTAGMWGDLYFTDDLLGIG